jgi:hypothetical protein
VTIAYKPGQHWTTKPPRGSLIDAEHPLARGLNLCLLCNEGTGNRLFDLAGRSLGTFTGSLSWTGSPFGTTLTFGNTSSYVTMPGNPSASAAWTVSVTFRLSVTPTNNYIYDQGANTNALHTIGTGANNLYMQYSGGALNPTFPEVLKNVWYTIVVTYDGVTAKFYRNGFLINSMAGALDTGTGFTVGDYGGHGAFGFQGQIASVLRWSRAISAEKILWLYREPYAFLPGPASRRGLGGQSALFRRSLTNRAGARGVA